MEGLSWLVGFSRTWEGTRIWCLSVNRYAGTGFSRMLRVRENLPANKLELDSNGVAPRLLCDLQLLGVSPRFALLFYLFFKICLLLPCVVAEWSHSHCVWYSPAFDKSCVTGSSSFGLFGRCYLQSPDGTAGPLGELTVSQNGEVHSEWDRKLHSS